MNNPTEDDPSASAEMAAEAQAVIDALADRWSVTPKPPNIQGISFEEAAFLALLWNRYQLLNELEEYDAAERLYEHMQKVERLAHGDQ